MAGLVFSPIRQRLRLAAAVLLCGGAAGFGMAEALGPDGINAAAVHAVGITGDGVRIGLLSQGNAREGHIAFDRDGGVSAVTLHDFSGQGLARSGHDTQMAGILVSAGSPIHPEAVGVAPGARVHSARIVTQRIHHALESLIKEHHCRVIVTGIQAGRGGDDANGNSILSKLYDYYAETYDVIFANAAGNNCPRVSVFGDGYNGITTAGLVLDDQGRYRRVGAASNAGPTADGRRKPDVAAPTEGLRVPSSRGDNFWDTTDGSGRGLTSFAVPHTAGVAALLLEAAGRTDVPDDDRSEVIKAVIVNSAVADGADANDLAATAPSAAVWEPDRGYGRLNAWEACRTLTSPRLRPDAVAATDRGWAYATLAPGAEDARRFSLAAGQRLVVTVTWHRTLTRLSPQLYLDGYPRFYLNLKLLDPDGKTAVFEPAGRDNLIKTDYRCRTDGEHVLVLKNPTDAENDYGLAFAILPTAGDGR